MNLNSACDCCNEPPVTLVGIEYTSVSQECVPSNCGFLPCTSDEPQTNGEEWDGVVRNTCTPNFADLTPAEICAGTRYLTKTFTAADGHTEVSNCVIDPNNPLSCDCTTECSGTITYVVNEYYLNNQSYEGGSIYQEFDETTTTTTTYNPDCTVTTETVCEGTNNQTDVVSDDSGTTTLTCTSQAREGEFCDIYDFQETCSGGFEGACDGYPLSGVGKCFIAPAGEIIITETTTPEPTETTSTVYSNVNNTGIFTPSTLPPFPEFVDCVPNEEPVYPELQVGQGYQEEAFQYENPNNPLLKSSQKVKFRIVHSPSASCYLKVWLRKVIQNYKFEDCSTGFAGDPPRTPAWTVDCEEQPCLTRWSTNGPPIYEDIESYEWSGSGSPCFSETLKRFDACENRVYSSEEYMTLEVEAGLNQSITLEWKFSFVDGYEPNWPDETGSTGCKPNGFPQAYQTGCE